jgi:hypothetical protein
MMTPEIWLVTAAVFLALAAAAGGLAMSAVRGPWHAVAIGARVVALALLIMALISAAIEQGKWIAADPQQAMLTLIVAMLVVHLVLAWRLGIGSAGPVVDIVALALSLVIVVAAEGGASGLACVRQSSLFQAYWVLLALGGGSVLVACAAGLMLALKRLLVWRGRHPGLPRQNLFCGLLAQATILALVALGSGLVISAWWAWQTPGPLGSGDPRQEWMAVAWLITATSLLAWKLDGRRSRWAAGLALVAAAAVLVGVLFPADLSLAGI